MNKTLRGRLRYVARAEEIKDCPLCDREIYATRTPAHPGYQGLVMCWWCNEKMIVSNGVYIIHPADVWASNKPIPLVEI